MAPRPEFPEPEEPESRAFRSSHDLSLTAFAPGSSHPAAASGGTQSSLMAADAALLRSSQWQEQRHDPAAATGISGFSAAGFSGISSGYPDKDLLTPLGSFVGLVEGGVEEEAAAGWAGEEEAAADRLRLSQVCLSSVCDIRVLYVRTSCRISLSLFCIHISL